MGRAGVSALGGRGGGTGTARSARCQGAVDRLESGHEGALAAASLGAREEGERGGVVGRGQLAAEGSPTLQEQAPVRAGAIFLFGDVIYSGGKKYRQVLKSFAFQALVPLLFHLVDSCPKVVMVSALASAAPTPTQAALLAALLLMAASSPAPPEPLGSCFFLSAHTPDHQTSGASPLDPLLVA